ncbi:MAG: M35 family metallo-endopeptidase [Gammaproteobacteria bacterium]|nr:M35 family metallo-endopeptidase [Gammaproteobacteria bacterium]
MAINFPVITVAQSKRNPGDLIDVSLLQKLYAAGYNLVLTAANSPSLENKKFWFGTGGQTNSQMIDEYSAKMKNYMNGGMKKLNFICTGTQGSMMSFNQYDHLKVPGGPAEDRLGKSNNVMANAGFTLERFSTGERIGAILHEITHMCIGTNDVTIGDKEYYGADYCRELALDNTNLALTNADNWCYYFTSYHNQIMQSGFDWRYLTPEEVAQRRNA